jgi:amidase
MGPLRYARAGWSLALGFGVGLTGARPKRLRPLDFSPFATAMERMGDARDGEIGALVATSGIAELRAAMDDGTLTSEELTIHLLRRIRALDGHLGSVIELDPAALDEARAADARRAAGAATGSLDGIPVTVKDNIETAGPLRTTAGSMALAEHVAAADAPVVVALRGAGAVHLGKTNLSELAGAVSRTAGVSVVGGRTVNPYGKAFSPAGSSSGSGVAVGAALSIVSVGTETSGSLIAPAAFNGVVGMKPSRDLVPGAGIVPLVRFQDSAGPMARSVADAAVLLAAIAAEPLAPELSVDALRGVVMGVLRADILAQKSPFEDTADNPAILARIDAGRSGACATAVDATLGPAEALKTFESGFTKVVLGGVSNDTVGYLAAAGTGIRTLADLHAFNRRHPRLRMPTGQFFLDLAMAMDIGRATYERAALDAREAATAILNATFEATGAALLVSLANLHSSLYATAGFPAITVPLGLRAGGMPTGVTLIGRAGQDAQLLAHAFAFEQATKLRVPPPVTT